MAFARMAVKETRHVMSSAVSRAIYERHETSVSGKCPGSCRNDHDGGLGGARAGDRQGVLSDHRALAKSGEVRGFTPGKAEVFGAPSAVRDAAGERPAEPEVRRLEAEGFVGAAIVRLYGRAERAAKGVSSVVEFETTAGASAEMKAELKKELDPRASREEGVLRYFAVRRFKVPGVSNAVAFSFTSNKAVAKLGLESGVAKGLFIQGNCLLSVVVFRPTSREVVKPVISGVQAISRRTGDACP